MSAIKEFIFGKPPPTLEESVDLWKKKLRTECRQLDRTLRQIEREEMKVKNEIKLAIKQGDQRSARFLAKELVHSRKAKESIHISKAQLNSIGSQLRNHMSTFKITKSLKSSSEIMTLMNNAVNIPQINNIISTMGREMMKAGIIEEFIDEVLEDEELSDEADEEVDKVLSEFALQTKDMLSKVPVAKDRTVEEDFFVKEGLKEDEL